MPNQKVLTDTDLESIKGGIERLDDADALIEQAQRAGIVVDDLRVRSREGRDRLMRLKQAFFPGE